MAEGRKRSPCGLSSRFDRAGGTRDGGLAWHRPGDRRRLAACGALDRRRRPDARGHWRERLQAIREAGGTAEGYAADVADPTDVQRVVDEIEAKFRRFTSWSITPGSRATVWCFGWRTTAWQDVIDTNLKGTFLFCRAVGRLHDAGALRADHQHQQRLGFDGQPGPGQLLGEQGGRDRFQQDDRPRAGLAGHHGQRRRPGVHHHRHDRRPAREGQDRGQGAQSPCAGWGRPKTSPTWSATWPAPAPAT